MKKLNVFNLVLVCCLAMGLMTFNSCTDDPCENVACVNGTLVEAGDNCSCDCDEGFSGADCTVEDLCVTNNVNCLNGGTCVDGTCACASGYEGDSCQTLSSAKFVGSYEVDDVCSESGSNNYNVTITASSVNADQVLISNFWDAFLNNVVATVDSNEITIASQEPDNDGFLVSGTGTYISSSNTITFTYTVTDGTDTDNCQTTYTKQ